MSSRRRTKLLRRIWIGALLLAFVQTGVFNYLDRISPGLGIVDEPYFWLVPMAWFSGFVAVVLAIVDFLIGLRGRCRLG